jgi:L-ascorbate metabolism protein UlaG (beta-lactamase superfamily)
MVERLGGRVAGRQKGRLTGLLVATVLVFLTCFGTIGHAQSQSLQDSQQRASIWYLRHAGWAVRIDDALLVFDYQESMQLDGVTADTPQNLENGFINPEEIAALDVYVFVTHAHGDHYDPVIFEWQGEIERLTYLIGWDEEPRSHCDRFVTPDASCYTMAGLRAEVELDRLQVYTIDSFHNEIPEVAYLVRIGDWVIYHNGDYMADHVADYAYLKTKADRADVAFVSGLPDRRWPHMARAEHLVGEFDVRAVFPMHFPDDKTCDDFAGEFVRFGITTEVTCPRAGGDRFVVGKAVRR